MVRKGLVLCLLLVALWLVLLPLLAPISEAPAQGLEEEQTFTLEEETRVEVDEVGDAHITDTITYDPAWFEEYAYVFKENPNLLSRRFRSDSNVGEVENFDVDIDSRNSAITISFDTPGYAYNMGDAWHIYGYGNYESRKEEEGMVELRASGTLSSEFTLFSSMPLEQRVIFDLPTGAENAAFDKEKGAITYELPYAAKGRGMLAGNKTTFTVILVLIMALSMFLFLFAVTRKPASPETVAGVSPHAPVAGPATPPASPTPFAGAGMPPAATEVSSPYPPGKQPPSAGEVEPPPAPAEEPEATAEGSKFCMRCGQPRSRPEDKFCRRCGTPY